MDQREAAAIEQGFREVRRRMRSIGTVVDDAGIERIIYGLVTYFNRKYETRTCAAFQKKRAAWPGGPLPVLTRYTIFDATLTN